MPTEAPAKPKRETWLDWLPEGAPEPELLSRDDLLARLQEHGIDMSTSELRYWEYTGVLPRPSRRWHQGATRALYPDFAVMLIQHARHLQDNRIPLSQIGPDVQKIGRTVALLLFKHHISADKRIDLLRQAVSPSIDASPTPTLIKEARQLAENREQLTGVPIERIEIRLTDAKGRRVTYPIEIKPMDPVDREQSIERITDLLLNPTQ